MLTSTYIGATLAGVAVFLLTAALWTHIRVLGRITTLRQAQMLIETTLEQLDVRLTREVKTRAALVGVEKAAEEKSIGDEARSILAAEATVVPLSGRPKRFMRRN